MSVTTSTELKRVRAGSSLADNAVVRSVWHFPHTIIVAGLVRLRDWTRRVAGRRALASLNDHYLRDIGLSPADVEAERNHLGLGQSIESLRHRGYR